MISSLTESTMKQYNVYLLQWKNFCESYNADFYNPSIKNILEFLTESYHDGASFGTINSQRCAISLISKEKIGADPLVSRFVKGIAKLKPVKPKYHCTWDVSIALNYIKKFHPLIDLTLKQVSDKAVLLLALSTAHRVQTLASINIENILETSEGLEIKIPDAIKTSGPGKYQPVLYLPRFKDCPEQSIYIYEALRLKHGV